MADGGSQLGSGVEELSDGANTLKDGMKEFDEDGIHKAYRPGGGGCSGYPGPSGSGDGCGQGVPCIHRGQFQ